MPIDLQRLSGLSSEQLAALGQRPNLTPEQISVLARISAAAHPSVRGERSSLQDIPDSAAGAFRGTSQTGLPIANAIKNRQRALCAQSK